MNRPRIKPTIPADAPLTAAERAAPIALGDEDPHHPIAPAPNEIVWPTHRKNGDLLTLPLPPPRYWEYRSPGGEMIGVVARWDRSNGKKLVMQCCFAEFQGSNQWVWGGIPARGRPPLYAPDLDLRNERPVILVEGEKTCDAARALLGDTHDVTTWMGGGNAWEATDWTVLDGRMVIGWPDNDKPGTKVMGQIGNMLRNRTGTRWAVVDIPVGLPEGWDLADPLPDTHGWVDIRKVLKVAEDRVGGRGGPDLVALNASARPSAPPPGPRELSLGEMPILRPDAAPGRRLQPGAVNGHAAITPVMAAEPLHGVDSDIAIRYLGYLNGRYYLQSAITQDVQSFTSRDLSSAPSFMQINPNLKFWADRCGGEVNWTRLGQETMESCLYVKAPNKTKEIRPFFSPSMIRGKGCWVDEGRTIFHAGDKLIVNGQTIDPIQIESIYTYEKADRFFDLGAAPALDEQGGANLRGIFALLPWQDANPLLADLACGLTAMAPICGALDFRSHGWISGPSSSGKSFVMDNVIGRCLGHIAIYPLQGSSEAGLRSRIQSDARPVIFDEAEGGNAHAAMERRQQIITLMRASSTNQRGQILKGTMDQKGHSFSVKSMFLLASIGVGLKEWADENRCLVLNLRGPTSLSPADKQTRKDRFKELQRRLAALPHSFDSRLLARMVRLVPVVREVAAQFSEAVQDQLGASGIKRIGDLIGTPLAAMWMLCHDTAPHRDEIDMQMTRYDFTPWLKGGESREDVSLVRHMVGKVVPRVVIINGSVGERSVGELMARVAGEYGADERIHPEEARAQLGRMGMLFTESEHMQPGFWFAQKCEALDQLMKTSFFQEGYIGVLASHQKAVDSRNTSRVFDFSPGLRMAGVFLPLSVLLPKGEGPRETVAATKSGQ